MKAVICLTITIVVFSGLVLVDNMQPGTVQAYVGVSGVITSDTSWTKTNSPYNLTGNMAVDKGVTLTIAPGVSVNLNSYYIRVNGTLTAIGTSIDNIHLNGATSYIEFTASSTGWNSQTSTGSIIENTVINSNLYIDRVSLMINNNTIRGQIGVSGASPIISKNTIIGTGSDVFADGISISNDNTGLIIDNTFSGDFVHATISIGGGSPTIERNLISNSYGYGSTNNYEQSGIMISENSSPIIKQNTITKSAVGISLGGSPKPTIVNNSIEDNTRYNLYLGSRTVNIDTANNWWGTTDTVEIDKKIWDYNDDFNLGRVNYSPFLTEPDSQAPAPNAPMPSSGASPSQLPSTSPSPSQNSTSTSDQSGNQPAPETDFYGIAVTALVVLIVIALIAVGTVLVRRKNRLPNNNAVQN